MAKSSFAIERCKQILKKPTSNFHAELRKLRHESWVLAAERSLNLSSTAKDICYHWSTAADKIVSLAWEHCGLHKFNLSLCALGKWGAQELNLSSDIDFFVISEHVVSKEEQKSFNNFLKLLNENSEYGFCFRTDIDIRPGGRFGPTINSLLQVQDYYWNSGATWEKVALVRLREICGKTSVFKEFKSIIEPFVYRKYLDYTLFEDLKSLRQKIHSSTINSKETNIKLYPGGIRDIELFINALQVIHGGREPKLRVTSTSSAIAVLKEKHILANTVLDNLEKAYWDLRNLENSIQAENDLQIHSTDLTKYPQIHEQMKTTHEYISNLIGYNEGESILEITGDDGHEWLKQLGFSNYSIEEIWPEIIGLTSKSAKSKRDEQARVNFLKEFVTALALRPFGKDLGLDLLKMFIKSTRAKATFFTTLLRDPTLIKDLAYIFSSSAFIGNYVASRPELVDSLILKRESLDSLDMEDFLTNLVEKKKIQQIFTVINFLKNKNVQLLCTANSQIADEICIELLQRLKNEMHCKSNLELLALGKWGGNELGIGSDLDLIFISDSVNSEDDFKLARRFLSRLSEQQKAGALYSYDLRLRPSGNSGPILVSVQKLIDYLQNSAQAWEKQSFLRARSVFGSSNLTNLSYHYIDNGLTKENEKELQNILDKLMIEKLPDGKINLKFSRGGLINTELITQKIILKEKIHINATDQKSMLKMISESKPLLNDVIDQLTTNYNFLRFVEQMYQVKCSHSGSELYVDSISFEQVCLELDLSPDNLIKKINKSLDQNTELLKTLCCV